jgi:cytochrome c2
MRAVALACLLALAWLAGCDGAGKAGRVDGDPQRGRLALTQYACRACHQIPGVTGSDVHVGPSLKGLAGKRFIARDLPNTPANLARWIRDPHAIDPSTAMPALGVNETDARDIVAYLMTLD